MPRPDKVGQEAERGLVVTLDEVVLLCVREQVRTGYNLLAPGERWREGRTVIPEGLTLLLEQWRKPIPVRPVCIGFLFIAGCGAVRVRHFFSFPFPFLLVRRGLTVLEQH